jgi:hypothetical protein
MQGKVMDGQYINQKFICAMNDPVLDVLRQTTTGLFLTFFRGQCSGIQDTGSIKYFKDSFFINRLLQRTALYHQLFGHGKMHSVDVETSKELLLLFCVTNAFAHQRFMSSSYLSLTNLEESLEGYIETFKDHNNRPDVCYNLYGRDFIINLLGILDLLWPLVVLMLQLQAQWCPGWKFESYIPGVQYQLTMFTYEMDEDIPYPSICPRLNKHLLDIMDKKYGRCELDNGWILIKQENKSFKWVAREPADCMKDLKELARNMKVQLVQFPMLNSMLHKCLDVGILFRDVLARDEPTRTCCGPLPSWPLKLKHWKR